MKQTALFPGNEDRVGYWLTPPALMARLQAEFDFNFDACPYPRPAGFDGLKEPWGTRTWCNPPWRGAKMAWGRKALLEQGRGNLVVMICALWSTSHLPELMAEAKADCRLENVLWLDPQGRPAKHIQTAILFILHARE